MVPDLIHCDLFLAHLFGWPGKLLQRGVGDVGTSNELVSNAVAYVNAMLVEEGGKGGAFAHLFLVFFHVDCISTFNFHSSLFGNWVTTVCIYFSIFEATNIEYNIRTVRSRGNISIHRINLRSLYVFAESKNRHKIPSEKDTTRKRVTVTDGEQETNIEVTRKRMRMFNILSSLAKNKDCKQFVALHKKTLKIIKHSYYSLARHCNQSAHH